MRRRKALKSPALVSVGLAGVMVAVALWQPARAQFRSPYVHQIAKTVIGYRGRREFVLMTYPRRLDRQQNPPGQRYPLVVALHGLGEANKGQRRGALGWNVDYGLPDAFGAFAQRRLTRTDYRGLVERDHLERVNAALQARPFVGVAVVTPFTPNFFELGNHELRHWSNWLATRFLEQVRDEFQGVARTRQGTGIDGVSLGGWVALEAGFSHPQAFGSVGAIQPAIRGREASLAARATALQQIRLLTSQRDPFLEPTRELSRRLRRRHVAHTLSVFPGDHSYEFNRGPGNVELLRFHNGALARETIHEGGGH